MFEKWKFPPPKKCDSQQRHQFSSGLRLIKGAGDNEVIILMSV